jgi:glycosyltransferase involved in cell wall biosynthesis
LSVLGQSFANSPPCFAEAREQFVDAIEHWGFVESRRDYLQVLATADVFVSTAVHEFFGLSAVEAMMHCSVVLLPDRLSYPELLGPLAARYTYGGSSREGEEIDRLVARLSELAQLKRGGRWHCGHAELSRRAGVFQVERRAAEMDARLDEVVKRFSSRLPGGDGASG